jgi:quercetin dioxygenase-like cupin family protein
MLSRRLFSGCALCGALGSALGLTATAANAQPAPGGLVRTLVRREDVVGTNFETIQMLVEIPAHGEAAPHTHPGHEASYIVEGEGMLMVAGQPPRAVKPGDSFLVPAGVVHSAKNGPRPQKIFATFVVEKGKPLATPA